MSDITRQQAIGAQLEKIRSELSRVHHDINNPLSVIAGNVELLAELTRALELGEDIGETVSDLQHAVELLTEQVDRLLAVRGLLSQVSGQLDEAS